MNILSLFDGMSCGQIALKKLKIPYDNYYASEIDAHAMYITQKNFPATIQLGNIKELSSADLKSLPKIDLLMGGSPCQGFSFGGKGLNFDDPRSKLFFDFAKILEKINPKYFLLENVRMNKKSQDIISGILGMEPIKINSSLVSAQNRVRLYWTNIIVDGTLKDEGLVLENILEKEVNIKYLAGEKLQQGYEGGNQLNPNFKSQCNTIYNRDGKFGTLCAGTHGYSFGYVPINDFNYTFRKLTPLECERLQTVPDNYTSGVSDTQRYKMLGNGWTIDVICHILKNII